MADIIELEIDSLNAAGDGVSRYRGRTIAVPFTIPGERVRARLAGSRALAEPIDILRASPHRVAAGCRHFGPSAEGGRICGGCAWQHIAYPEQLRLKAETVSRLVREAVPSAPPASATLAAAAGAPWGYRNKVHFAIAAGARGALVMGHYARFSRRVIPIHECPVHDPRGNEVAFALRDACAEARVRTAKGIAVRAGCTTHETMATLVVTGDPDRNVRAAARRVLAGAAAPSSLHVNLHPRGDAFIFGRTTRHVAGPERLREDVAGASFLISPTAFFQTNVRAAEVLVREALAAIPRGASVLDLYAGAGLFALPLAARGHRVVAVEENRAAVEDGRASLRLTRVSEDRCRFVAAPVEEALAGPAAASRRFDAVVLDPPREGATPLALDRLFGRTRPAIAVYVSCDPVSLARDLRRIASHGYLIRSLQPVDMFPHTPHIETVAALARA